MQIKQFFLEGESPSLKSKNIFGEVIYSFLIFQ